MAHEIVQGADNLVYSLRDGVPWHGLGVPVPEYASAAEAARIAIPWSVLSAPIMSITGASTGSHELVRVDPDGARRHLAVVGSRYQVLQPAQWLEWVCAVAGVSDSDAAWSVVGSLRGGRMVWAVLSPQRTRVVAPRGEEMQSYLTFATGYDGHGAVQAYLTTVRTVCQNTYVRGLRVASDFVAYRHTSKLADRIQSARDALGIVVEDAMRAEEDRMATLESIPLTSKVVYAWCEAMWPLCDTDGGPITERAINRRLALHDRVADLAYVGRGNRGRTGWDLINGLAEYVQHVRPLERAVNADETPDPRETREHRMMSTMWQAGRATVDRGVAELLRIADRSA